MAVLVEIPAQPSDGGPSVDLAALLRHLAPAAEQLAWSILDFDARAAADRAPAGGMLALEDQIHASPTGLRCTWSELVALADTLEQVIDGLFVGTAPDEPPPQRAAEADLRRHSRIILEAHDSTNWRIYLADDALGQRLSTTFPGATHLDPASTTW